MTIALKVFDIPDVLALIIGGLVLNILIDVNSLVTDFQGLESVITELALAYIGYKIGNEIDFEVLRKKGRKFGVVLLGEALGAFILIALGMFLLTHKLGLSLLLGSIGMATAPAATTLVLSQYKAQGEMTQAILFIIAFDDTMAILFVDLSLGFIIHEGEALYLLIPEIIYEISLEIFLSVLGGLIGLLIIYLLLKLNIMTKKSSIEWIYGTALMLIGLSLAGHVNTILILFVWGIGISVLEKHFSQLEEQMEKIEILSIPILYLFFILVGLLMDLDKLLEFATLILAVAYTVSRGIGKGIGSYLSSSVSNLSTHVKNNLPFSLLTQAGVAIGLSSLSYHRLLELHHPEDADLVINIIGISIVITEILALYLVKKAIFRSGEATKNS